MYQVLRAAFFMAPRGATSAEHRSAVHTRPHFHCVRLSGICHGPIREKIFKNYALKSMYGVRAKLKQAILYIECNPKFVRPITSFPYIVNSF